MRAGVVLGTGDERQLSLWTVYDHPRDFPDCFVARRTAFDMAAGVYAATTDMFTADSLAEIRALLPPGLTNLGRMAADDPVILEVWI